MNAPLNDKEEEIIRKVPGSEPLDILVKSGMTKRWLDAFQFEPDNINCAIADWKHRTAACAQLIITVVRGDCFV